MISVRVGFCYTEFTFRFFGCRRASVCIILAGTLRVGPPASSSSSSSAASTPLVGPASPEPGSGRRTGEDFGVVDAGVLLVFVFV